jgi:hypothetical protein
MGPEIRVYATPAMIEMVCRNLLLEMVERGTDSVRWSFFLSPGAG